MTSSTSTFFAVAIGSRPTTVHRIFFGGALLSLPLIASLFDFVGVVRHPLSAWLPAAPGLVGIDVGLGGVPLAPLEVLWSLVLLIVRSCAADLLARRPWRGARGSLFAM